MLPDYAAFQFAGYIGMVSGGVGYEMFKEHLQTSFMYGYVPYSEAKTTIHTLAFKALYRTYEFQIQGWGIGITPTLSAGVNLDSGENSTLDLSSKYPDGYYMTNSVHFPLSVGISISDPVSLKKIRKLEYGAEVGTLATYLYYRIESPEVDPGQIYSLSFNVRVHFE